VETAVNISLSCGHLKPSARQLYLTGHTAPETCLQTLDTHRLIICSFLMLGSVRPFSIRHEAKQLLLPPTIFSNICIHFFLLNVRLCAGSLYNVVKFSENVWGNRVCGYVIPEDGNTELQNKGS
jgi:hypothetical protein